MCIVWGVECECLLSMCVQYLADVQEHLGETIVEVGRDMKVPSSEYDGKVVYGEKRKGTGAVPQPSSCC